MNEMNAVSKTLRLSQSCSMAGTIRKVIYRLRRRGAKIFFMRAELSTKEEHLGWANTYMLTLLVTDDHIF